MNELGWIFLSLIGFVLWWLLVDYSMKWGIGKHEEEYHMVTKKTCSECKHKHPTKKRYMDVGSVTQIKKCHCGCTTIESMQFKNK